MVGMRVMIEVDPKTTRNVCNAWLRNFSITKSFTYSVNERPTEAISGEATKNARVECPSFQKKVFPIRIKFGT